MKTSKTVKLNQKHPPTVLAYLGKDNWEVEGREQEKYLVSFVSGRFYCNCLGASRGHLCRHMIAVITKAAKRKGWSLVQFWTDQEDAKRQRRLTIEFETKQKNFWVTYSIAWARAALPEWVRKNAGRVVKVREDPFRPGLWDVYYHAHGDVSRFPVRRD